MKHFFMIIFVFVSLFLIPHIVNESYTYCSAYNFIKCHCEWIREKIAININIFYVSCAILYQWHYFYYFFSSFSIWWICHLIQHCSMLLFFSYKNHYFRLVIFYSTTHQWNLFFVYFILEIRQRRKKNKCHINVVLCFSLSLDSNEWKKSKMTLILLFCFYTITIHDKKVNKMLSRCCVLFECKRHVYICSLACKKVIINQTTDILFHIFFFTAFRSFIIWMSKCIIQVHVENWNKKMNFLCFLLFSMEFSIFSHFILLL